jgi:hypothetical protein
MHWASWMNVIVGVWLFVSPWILGVSDFAASGNNMLFGFLIVAVALPSALLPARVHALAWTNVAFGVWLIIAPWVLGYEAAASTWNATVAGAIVALLGLIRAQARRRGGVAA